MQKPFRLLSFDTSSAAVCTAVLEDGLVVKESFWEPLGVNRQETATMLMPSLEAILNLANCKKQELNAIVVGQGPGSFTGVRNSIVTARTLAQALNLPLLPVSRLECLGFVMQSRVAVVLAAGKEHFFIAGYDFKDKTMLEIVPPAYVNQTELAGELAGIDTWVCDDASLAAINQPHCQALPVVKNIAAVQGQIAWNKLSLMAAKELPPERLARELSWKTVEPLYLRGPSVTMKKDHGHSHKPINAS